MERLGEDAAEVRWRLESIIEATRVGTWEWNVQTGETTYSEAWASMLGYTLAELSPVSLETWTGLTHPHDLQRAMQLAEQHFAGKLPYYECDMRLRHKDGQWVWIQGRGQVINRTLDGKPLLMFGAHIDITERKLMEEQLRQSREHFFLSLEMASDAIFLIREHAWTYANASGLKLLGAQGLAQLIGSDIFDRVHPADHELVRRRLREYTEAGAAAPRERLQMVRLDGTSVDVEVTSSVINMGDALVHEVIMRDISEDLRAERELEHSRDLMRYVIEHAHSAVAVHDRDLNYIFVSQRYLDEYRVTERDVIGRHHYDVFPDLPEKWRIAHQRALAGEILSAEDDPYVREDGTVDWTRWECRPWHEADGTIGGIIVYTEVINEQKRTEERLLQYQARLRALAAELVTSCEREQRKLACELHDGVGQVLIAAKMEAQMLRAAEGDKARHAQATHLTELLAESIEEVRSLTTQLAPSLILERGLAVAMEWMTDRCLELHGLRCLVRVDAAAEELGTDTKMLLFRIAREALNNVARHAGVLRATVTIRCSPHRVSISVVDHGVGFDVSTINDPIHSRGFGLFSITEECLARGGSVKVLSEPGRGTRVTATIPDSGASGSAADAF